MSENKDLKDKLTPEEYYVTQNHGTEPAFSGKYDGVKTPGTYHCIVCMSNSLALNPNMIQVLDGQAFGNLQKKRM